MDEGPVVDTVLVDDCPDVRGLISLRLSRSGHFRIVGEGSSGHDAIVLAREHQPELLLLDVSMPGMDGLEALPKIRQASPGTRVVMFTGFAADNLADEALRLGAVDFVQKSTPFQSLVPRLLDAVARPIPEVPVAHAQAAPAEAAAETTYPDVHAMLDEHVERFSAVLDEVSIGMATLTLAGRLVRTNRALAELFGEPVPHLVGRPYSDFASPGWKKLLDNAVTELGQRERVVAQVEHSLRRGEQLVLSTLSSIRDSKGNPLYLFAQVQDITERREIELALRQSEERFRLLVESVADYAIFMLDADGHITSWNLGAERMKGYRADEIIGEHFRVFYTPEDQAAGHPEDELRRAVAEGRYQEEGWRVRNDGSRFRANVVVTPLYHDGELVGFAKVTRDISERPSQG
jgi:PAS domain S-box-containing protein